MNPSNPINPPKTIEHKDTSLYLSVVVPLYNEEESVEKLLESILLVAKQFDFTYEKYPTSYTSFHSH